MSINNNRTVAQNQCGSSDIDSDDDLSEVSQTLNEDGSSQSQLNSTNNRFDGIITPPMSELTLQEQIGPVSSEHALSTISDCIMLSFLLQLGKIIKENRK
ncbi:hypothetical protein [Candidatus Ichthyocystis hellenicum]|uniref:hypothetical protein n=1 Tax=Candidatus Ichthyocystis hellenicum TaxID=1561003 RepID=UPI000B898D67|nr:hypothetical protein [Candidatus Ichthyocystis hellenicum]